MKKKMLALFLTVVLIVSLMPATVFAARDSLTAVTKTAPAQLEKPLEPNGIQPQASYTVSVTGGSNGYTELLTGSSAEAGSEVYFQADPDDGYLETVYVDGIDPNAVTYVGYGMWGFFMPAGNVQIEVEYTPAPGSAHSVQVEAGQGGVYDINRTSAWQGESVYLAVKPDNPNEFLYDTHVFANGGELYYVFDEEGIYYYELFMPAEDVAVFVEYKKSGPFAVSAQITSGEGGTVTLAQNEAWYLDTVTATVIPDKGYEVLSVQAVSHDGLLVSNASWVGNQYSFTMHPGDTTVQVYFTKTHYQVLVSAGAGGTAYADRSQAQMGDTVTLICQPDAGFEVDTITGVENVKDLGNNRYSFVMPAAWVNIQVNFKPADYPVSVVMMTTVGGTVAADYDEAMPGETVTLTAELEEGYRVAKLTGVEYTDNGDGTYSFTMPGKPVEIQVWILHENNPFLDVQEPLFYYEPVMWAVENGITNGISASEFGALATCNRAQVVTFLWRANGKPEPAAAVNPFTDVTDKDFFYEPVLWAVENGITNGMSADKFGSLSTCNRAQVVTFLWRASGEPEPATTVNPFTDVTDKDFFYKPVLWAVENGITNGVTADTFAPNGVCNRAQVVTFLYRASQIAG